MEAWAKRLALDSGQKVDWHFVGGRAVVKALGDLEKVDQCAYYVCRISRDNGKTFQIETMDGDGKLANFGGAKSCYGYYPGGHNHWSNFRT